MRDYWGEPSGEPRPDYRDAVEPDVPIEHEGKPARGERLAVSDRDCPDDCPRDHEADVPDLLGALRQSIEKARAQHRLVTQRCVHGRLLIDPCWGCDKERRTDDED